MYIFICTLKINVYISLCTIYMCTISLCTIYMYTISFFIYIYICTHMYIYKYIIYIYAHTRHIDKWPENQTLAARKKNFFFFRRKKKIFFRRKKFFCPEQKFKILSLTAKSLRITGLSHRKYTGLLGLSLKQKLGIIVVCQFSILGQQIKIALIGSSVKTSK